jgi:hypothetical protein
MTVDDAYRILRFIVRKNQLGSLSPSDFQDAFNTAQRNYYDLLIGRIEQYQYGSAKPRIGLGLTDNVVSRLMPFYNETDLTVSSGAVAKPVGLNKIYSIFTTNMYRVYRLEENRLSERLQDSIDPIDEANAFYVETYSTLNIYPTTLTTVHMTYFNSPVDVKWNYTLDGSGRPVYSASGSVQPVWLPNDYDEIIARAAKIIGVSLKEPMDIQYGEQVIAKGE